MTKHKTGYNTADTRQGKVVIGTLAAEARRKRSPIRVGMSIARRVPPATAVARREARVRPLHKARGQVG